MCALIPIRPDLGLICTWMGEGTCPPTPWNGAQLLSQYLDVVGWIRKSEEQMLGDDGGAGSSGGGVGADGHGGGGDGEGGGGKRG